MKINKLVLTFTFITLVLALLASSFILKDKVEHNCIGENCPVCSLALSEEKILRTIKDCKSYLIGSTITTITLLFSYVLHLQSTLYKTLITKKVRMND